MITLGDAMVLSGMIRMPRKGAWIAVLDVDATTAPPAGRLLLTTDDGTFGVTGTVERGEPLHDLLRVRLVGGGGGLTQVVPAKTYRFAPVRLVLEELLSAVGEILSPTSDQALLGQQLPHWSRKGGEAGDALELLVEELGATWRVLPDGTIWVGTDTWPTVTLGDAVLLEEDAAAGTQLLGVARPGLLPAVTLEGKRVSLVEHHITSGAVRTYVWFERDDGRDGNRLLVGIRRLLRRMFGRVDYYAVRTARVVSQAADGTLDIIPDDPAWKDIQRVPIRYGVPGVRAKVPPGTRCHFTFDGGNPRVPMVVGFEPGAALEITLGDSAGARGVARQGDLVSLTIPPVVPVTGTVSGAPFVGTMTVTTPLTGSIITASGRVKAAQ